MLTEKCEQNMGDVGFSAEGIEAMEIQERMFQTYIRANNIRILSSYALAALFAIGAFTLILFGPSGRETTIIVFSVSFIVMSAGIAGFTQFKARGFGAEIAAARNDAAKGYSTRANSAQKSRKAEPLRAD